MLALHGTSRIYLDSILKNGLQPRGRKPGNWRTNCEGPTVTVHFTDLEEKARFFVCRAALSTGVREGVIISFDTDKLDQSKLICDENWLDHKDMMTSKEPRYQCSFELRRKQIQRALKCKRWKESLKVTNLAAYKGVIPPEAIVDYTIVDATEVEYWHPEFDKAAPPEKHMMLFDKMLANCNTFANFTNRNNIRLAVEKAHLVIWKEMTPDNLHCTYRFDKRTDGTYDFVRI
jgi:hypothetical protein